MPNLLERAAASLGFVRAPKTQQSYGRGPLAKYRMQLAVNGYDPRLGAKLLRNYSRNNEWVRLAIDYRRQQISKAKWKIVRTDDPDAPVNPTVDKAVRQLFSVVNPKLESFEWLLDMVLEDVLVLDAGCIEKEHTLGGAITALWSVDGATIVPDDTWDGSDPNAIRYYQVIDGRQVAKLKNSDLVYMMSTPTTYSAIGWSPVKTLLRAIEADLYGEQYDFEMLKQTAPSGVLDLGQGLTQQQVEQYREYYEDEIAGTKELAIFGGNEPGSGSPNYIPFQKSNKDQQRMEYKTWLVKKIAAVFQIDKSIFNITEAVNRATSKTQQSRTDEGLEALASTLARFITREIIWEFDENHGFQFDELTDRDETQQAEVETTYVGSGVWTINEVRAKQGLDPVPWGDNPWVPQTGPVSDVPPPSQQEQMDNANDQADKNRDSLANNPPDDESKKPKDGKHWHGCGFKRGLQCGCAAIYDAWARSGKSVAPFVLEAARHGAQMRSERLAYLNSSEVSLTTNVDA